MSNRKKYLIVVFFICLPWIITGCVAGTAAFLKPQSHFDFPNSNVIPLGKVQGEASKTDFIIANPFDADVQEEAIQNALKQKGGDLLIDYVTYYKVTFIPFIPIVNWFYFTTIKVDGTACKMEIGEKTLK
jgi:hypothetical protein